MKKTSLMVVLASAMMTVSCSGVLVGPEEGQTPGVDPANPGGLIEPLPAGRSDAGVAYYGDAAVRRTDGAQNPGQSKKSDKGVPPGKQKDQGVASPDSGVTPPQPDQGTVTQPKPDQGTVTQPQPDAGSPAPDSGSVVQPPPPTSGTVYYVRPGGGSATQCTGKTNADYPGSGTGQACAFKHPFYALPPSGTALLKGGDTLFIAKGSYRMGYGAPGDVGCSSSYPWDCGLPALPSGPDASHPTRILGEGWDSGCSAAPEFYGVERSRYVVDLTSSSNIDIQCLEITDHSGCVTHHSGGLACNRSTYPYGDWAGTGIRASDSANVTLRNVNVHGLAHTGIWAGRIKDWTMEKVRIVGNGWVGWDGDLNAGSQGSGNSGTITFRKVDIEWNGCAETYPGEQPAGCWGQTAGGYGDGLGTAATAGDWIFEDCKVRYNTSDGLDLLYKELGGKVIIKRLHAEGNAGNQVKITGGYSITNSLLIGNCSFFKGKSFTHSVDHCRALGNTLSTAFQAGTTAEVVNNTIWGEGDVLLTGGSRASTCNGTERWIVKNNILVGSTDFHQPFEKTALFYIGTCPGLSYKGDYNIVYNTKNDCAVGPNDICADPKIDPPSGNASCMCPKAGSPAIDSGTTALTNLPGDDFLGHKRPYGSGVDRGAYEVGAP